MTKKSASLFILTILLVLLISPIIVKAQPPPPINVAGILGRFTNQIIKPLFVGLIIIMTAITGILYLMARGDPSKVTAANKALMWTIVGVAVGGLANLMYGLVSSIVLGTPPGP